jgi:hypothetical protein
MEGLGGFGKKHVVLALLQASPTDYHSTRVVVAAPHSNNIVLSTQIPPLCVHHHTRTLPRKEDSIAGQVCPQP